MDVIAKCRATSDYERKDPSELGLKTGDVVEVLRQGKFIWYGRLGDSKGFFPNSCVEIMEDFSNNNKQENVLSPTAIADNEKNGSVVSTGKATPILDEIFPVMEPTRPLEDKRRTRAKSAGRPPSQVFIKGSILQRTNSMDIDNLSDASDEQPSEKQVGVPSSTTKVTSMTQLVMELKQKPQVLKSTLQKDLIVNSTPSNFESENADNIPVLTKPKAKKKLPDPAPKPVSSNSIPPWMKEIRERRVHKLSLRGDEQPLKMMTEQQTQEISTSKHVEMKSYSETRATSHFITEESQKIQTKSFNSRTQQVGSGNVITTRRVSRNSFTDNSVQGSDILPPLESVENSSKNTEVFDKLSSSSNLTPQKNIAATEVVQTITVLNSTSSGKPSTDHYSNNEISNAYPLEKIELQGVTKNVNEPKLLTRQTSKVTETDDIISIKKDDLPLKPTDSSEKNKENTKQSLQQLLNEMENFVRRHKANSSKVQEDIKKLEMSIKHQHEEIKIYTEVMKVKLSTMMEAQEN